MEQASRLEEFLWRFADRDEEPIAGSFLYYLYSLITTFHTSRRMAQGLLDLYDPAQVLEFGRPSVPTSWRRFMYSYQPFGNILARVAKRKAVPVRSLFSGPRLRRPFPLAGMRNVLKSELAYFWWSSRSARALSRAGRENGGRRRALILSSVGHMLDYLVPCADELRSHDCNVILASELLTTSYRGFSHLPLPQDYMAQSGEIPVTRGFNRRLLSEMNQFVGDPDLVDFLHPALEWIATKYSTMTVWATRRMRKMIAVAEPDVILASCPIIPSEAAVLAAARRMGIPSVSLQHGPILDPELLFVGADRIMVWGREEATAAGRCGGEWRGRVDEVGIDFPLPGTIIRPRSGPSRILVLCDQAIGLIDPCNVAGIMGLFPKFAAIAAEYEDIEFVVRPHPAIAPGYYATLEILADARHIRFERRRIPHEDMGTFVAEFDYVLGDLCHPYVCALSLGVRTAFWGAGLARHIIEQEAGRADRVVTDEKSLRVFIAEARACPHPDRKRPAVNGDDLAARRAIVRVLLRLLEKET